MRDSLAETIAALESIGKPVPEPGSDGDCCSKFFPKSFHARLAARIKTDYKKRGGDESFY